MQEQWLTVSLQHEFHRNLRCLAWKPLAGRVIACGTSHGVCVWTLTQSRKVDAYMRYLRLPCDGPVQQLSWHPAGSLLACAAQSLVVFDYTTGEATVLGRAGRGIIAAAFSPTGSHLATAAESSHGFLIWETRTWTCERWGGLGGPCAHLAWGGEGHLAAASSTDSAIHFFRVDPTGAVHVRTESLAPYSVETARGREATYGGNIAGLAWDQTGERLAVSVRPASEPATSAAEGDASGDEGNAASGRAGAGAAGSGTHEPLVALFAARTTKFLDLVPRGWVRPPFPDGAVSTCPKLAFRNHCRDGAVLATLTESGRLAFVPMYFTKDQKE